MNPDFVATPDAPGLDGINVAMRLYVIPAGGGVSCFGFDNAHAETAQAAAILGRPDLEPTAPVGTPAAFAAYQKAMGELSAHYRANPNATHYAAGTPLAVRHALENARKSGDRVRIWLGDPETGRAWEDRPESGTIGRSMGPHRVPLLIKTRRSTGGGAILTSCVVAMACAHTGRWLYRHPSFSPKA